jgi:predicted site-specific integrase-resolvase
MLTPEEAAALAQVSSRTIYRRVEAGELHFAETPEEPLLICLDSLTT